MRSRQSVLTVRTQRSACAFAFGAWIGVWSTTVSSLRKTSSKGRLNLLSRSWIRNRGCSSPRSATALVRLRACWVTQAPLGLLVTATRSTRRRSSETEKEHVQPSQEHGVDGEEVARPHARRLLA